LSGNLRDRLKRIQTLKQAQPAIIIEKTTVSSPALGTRPGIEAFIERGWSSTGTFTLKREVKGGAIDLPRKIPEAAYFVMPGINSRTTYENLLFFDLETTGLSTGAGTVAFLAAFGRLTIDAGKYSLNITQHLLLDFPGEYDFIRALLAEFNNNSVMVSYNGKNFDSPILAARCLMNGITPPEYCHADLLYPARRFWKQLLPDCRQATIETGVLGIDRQGDIPGSMAPEIWFNFLNNNETEPLLGICEHNRCDIAGLASIFSLMARIAEDPLTASKKHKFDLGVFSRQARFLFREKKYDEGRDLLFKAAELSVSERTRAMALRMLAIDSEWRQKNKALALELTQRALKILPPESPLYKNFKHREKRLTNKE
jgi:uncharacterized protein YprB with RNaseH-like and TPR domain